MAQVPLLIIVSVAFVVSVGAEIEVTESHDQVTVIKGEAVQLSCKTNTLTTEACTWTSPKGEILSMFKGANYDDNRIQQYDVDGYDCSVEVRNVYDGDNGVWKCTITAKHDDQPSFSVASGEIDVVVAVAPEDVELRIDGQTVLGSYRAQLGGEVNIDCAARGARPEPTFTWFIGNTPINGVVNTKRENVVDNGTKADYVQTFTYYADPSHNGQELRCHVDHMAYLDMDKENKTNEQDIVLEVLYPPVEKKPDQFYGLQEGVPNDVRMKFSANPKPSTGTWILDDGLEIDVGTSNEQYRAGAIEEGDVPGEYSAVLTILNLKPEQDGKTYTLNISNNEGSREYKFLLGVGDQPPAGGPFPSVTVAKGESAGGLTVGVIILVVVIILLLVVVVVARAKKLFCFAVKSKMDEDSEQAADKEGSDTESAEHDGKTVEVRKNEGKDMENKEEVKDGEGKRPECKRSCTVTAKVTSFIASVKRSVSSKGGKTKYDHSDSEMKLQDENVDEKKDSSENGDKDDITYADLDKSAMSVSHGKATNLTVEDEKTQYAEIKPQT